MTAICKHCYIAGQVQGVGYRAATARKAKELGLTGWVRNLPDRRVEAVFCGTEAQVKLIEEWLWQGPSLARVDTVIVKVIARQKFTEFEISR